MDEDEDCMAKRRRISAEAENSNDSLDFTIVENIHQSHASGLTASRIKQEQSTSTCRNRNTSVLEGELPETRQSRDLGPADGVVMCGQCNQRRATLVCMEQACVSFAYRSWNMTSLFICDDCDITLHDGNPIMAEHLRSRLVIRSYNVESVKQPTMFREPVPVMIQENQNQAVSPVLQNPQEGPSTSASHYNTSSDSERHYNAFRITSSHAKLSGRQLNLMLERVHERYQTVLQHNIVRQCPLTETFRETKVARQTLVDAIAIAELRIVDPARYDEVMASYKDDKMAPRMFDVETTCRIIMREYTDTINRLRGNTLIPFRFNVYVSRK